MRPDGVRAHHNAQGLSVLLVGDNPGDARTARRSSETPWNASPWSARAYHLALRVSRTSADLADCERTTADLADCEQIEPLHVAEAIQHQPATGSAEC